MPTQTGSIDFTSTGGFKSYATNKYATQSTVSDMQTAISQNATDIALRATKTEASQMAQPNLSPYFSACQNTDFFTNANYPIISTALGTIGTQLDDGWLHVDMDNSARSATAYLNTCLKKPSWAKNSTEYTWLIEVRNFTLTSGSYIRFSPAQDNSTAQTNVTGYKDVTVDGSYYVKSTTRADATTNSAYTTFSRGFMQANAGVNASFDVRYSVYEGDYSGPYKPYGGDGFYATSAELKVANDAISSKVSTTDYNGSTIASLINQSASTVQIQAQHIQLDGEVTFGAIKDYADAAYDAIGAADAVQVGGRNLLQREWRVDDNITRSGITYTCNADGSITLNGTSTAQHVFVLAQSLTLSAGTYTLSGCPAGGGTNSYQLDILTVPVSGGTTETRADNGNGVTFETPGGTTGQVRIRVVSEQTLSNLTFWPKLERGNRATDWSPAPEDVDSAISNVEGRVSTNETSISNNASAIALKANSSDVYTKTAVDGKITQEVSDRNAAITAKANEITSSVSETYATKSSVNGKADASDVTALAGRVTTAESNITQNANNIALKVSESDVTGNYLVGKINLDSTTASIAAQRINLQGAVTISDLASDAQNATLNSNISVGGRNLLYNTGDFAGWLVSGNYAGSATDGIWTFPAPSSLNWSFVMSPFPALALSDYDGETLTLSFDYRSDDFGDTSGNHYVCIETRGQDSAYANTRTKYRRISRPIFNGVFVPTTEWQRGSITFTMSESLFTSGSGVVTHFCIQFYNYTLNSYQLRHVKLEKGNKATDWSPAPEDMTAALAGTNESLTNAIADIGRIDVGLTDMKTDTAADLATMGSSIETLQGALNTEVEARKQWFNFKASEGLRIGENDSAFHTLVTSTSMEFKNGGTTLATASGSEFEAPVMRVTNELHMGGWMWARRDNSHLSLKWIG